MRAAKLAFLRAARAAGGFALARRLTRPAVRILCYHGTWRVRNDTTGDFRGDAMFMAPETFRARLATLRRLDYPVVTLDHAIEGLAGRRALPPNAVAITIDDGWFGTYADMLPALAEFGMPATLYCDTEQLNTGGPVPHVMARWLARFAPAPVLAGQAFARATDRAIPHPERLAEAEAFATAAGIDTAPFHAARAFAYMTGDELRRAAATGLDVQLHTHRHTLDDMSVARIGQEVADNTRALAGLLGAAPRRHFCYPSGIASPAAAAALRSLGLASATTTRQALAWPGDDLFLLPRLLDGEQVTPIEFEAEISGFADLLRRAKRQ